MIEERDYNQLINDIYTIARRDNPDLEPQKLFTTIALYYKFKYKRPLEQYPPTHCQTLQLLVKDPKETDLHYLADILYSKNRYAIAIKQAEFEAISKLKKTVIVEEI